MPGSLLDVPGLRIGHWTGVSTGCTVVLLPPAGGQAAVDVRGGGPASFNTETLAPGRLGSPINAVVFSGGSAFGLETACGVMQWLAEQRIGLPFGGSVVPIVCGAAIFDLGVAGGPPPDKRAGYEACQAAAGADDRRGAIGAGAGATVGKTLGRPGMMRGGLGMASWPCGEHIVGALAVVNAVGDVAGRDGQILAGARLPDGSFAGPTRLIAASGHIRQPAPANTTLCLVATTAPLSRDGAVRLATMAHDGLARAIRPAHTLTDGDMVFAVSVPAGDASPHPDVGAIGTVAAEALQDAIIDAVTA